MKKEEITADKAVNPKKVSWHRVYYLLAFFDVLIVVFGLFLNHHLISVQQASVQDNQMWVKRLDEYLALRAAVNNVNKPGNDVFESRDAVLERNNLERYLAKYNDEYGSLSTGFNEIPHRFRDGLRNDLDFVDQHVQAMAIQSRSIFDSYEKGDTETAGTEMARMDQIQGVVNDGFNKLYSHVIQIQHELLTEEAAYVQKIQKYEFLTAAFVLLMVTVAVLYGTRMKKRIEEATQEHEKNLQLTATNDFTNNIIASMADMMVTVDDEGLIVNVNEAALKQMGYTQDELVGRPISTLTQKKEFLDDKEYELLKANRKLADVEKDFVRKNGKVFRCLVSASILNNFKTAAVVVAKDMSRRLEDERKLRDYAKQLQQSNRELQDFAHVASHDLQEPLRKVQAFGDRLARKFSDSLGEEGSDYVRRMQDASNRMQNLINDLLTFSRVTSKAQPFQQIDVKNVTEDVVSDLEVRIEETNGKVVIGDLPQIEADPTQIRQLMQNLIGNALKFHHPDKSPVVNVYTNELTAQSDGSFQIDGDKVITQGTATQYCQIIVQDNGIGFDEKYRDQIFTVFQRLHGREQYSGSGVGLAVCRKIVERHGGEITARSQPGFGSEFVVTLPLKQTQGEETNA